MNNMENFAWVAILIVMVIVLMKNLLDRDEEY